MEIRQWRLPEQDPAYSAMLAEETGRPELVCRVLAARGYRSGQEIEAVLRDAPSLDDPFLIRDMDRAVARIHQALEQGERICVYGDYDCDGITSTALLVSYFQTVGADVIYYIPDREKEGYGLNLAAVDFLFSQNVGLLVTVDNGIASHAEIAHAAELGVDVVVTDHHTPRETLPAAVAVVNPHRADCPSRYKELAGVGVAFKLVCALEGGADSAGEMLDFYSELVTIGTIADVVPLTGENRIIVRHGLRRLAESDLPGVAALIDVAGLSGRELTSESVAFGISPRINAAGRIGVADDVVELLLTDDREYAEEIAQRINDQNNRRKQIEEQISASIDEQLLADPQIRNRRILIIQGEGWHHGVVGIVASRLMERYQKPCIIFSIDGEEARGSGRSVPGFSLIEAIVACSEHLTRFGGHTLAAGLTIPVRYLDNFCECIQQYAREHYPVMPLPELAADCEITPRELTVGNIAELACLEPFGAGNEAPLFHISGLMIEGIYPTADKKHVRVRFSAASAQPFYAIYFGVSEKRFPFRAGEAVELMAKVSVQEYNGKSQLSVKISDLRPLNVPQEAVRLGRERYACYLRGEEQLPEVLGKMLPARGEIAVVYKYLRRVGSYPYGADALYLRLMPTGIDYCRMLIALDVLVEMGFVRRQGQGGGEIYCVVPDAPHADLANSAVLRQLATLKVETLVNEF